MASGVDNSILLDKYCQLSTVVHHLIIFYVLQSISSKYKLPRRYHLFRTSGPGPGRLPNMWISKIDVPLVQCFSYQTLFLPGFPRIREEGKKKTHCSNKLTPDRNSWDRDAQMRSWISIQSVAKDRMLVPWFLAFQFHRHTLTATYVCNGMYIYKVGHDTPNMQDWRSPVLHLPFTKPHIDT